MRSMHYMIIALLLASISFALTPMGWGTKFGGDVPGLEGGIYDVPPIVCNNNGVCDPGERKELCTQDCKPTPKCFNHWCEFGESPETCPYDCSIKGNNCIIDPDVRCPFGWVRGESWVDEYGCERLGNCIEVCNRNGKCDGNENIRTCPDDCSGQAIAALEQEYDKKYNALFAQLQEKIQEVEATKKELKQRQKLLDTKIQGMAISSAMATQTPQPPQDRNKTSAYAFFLFFSTLGLIGVMSYYSIVRRLQKPAVEPIPPEARHQEPYIPYLRSLFLRADDHDRLEQQLLQQGWNKGVVGRARRGP